jgi:hydroxymethylglutaryl-CoA synthase
MAYIKYTCGYIPFFRLSSDEIKTQVGVRGPSEKAFACYDEDPVTLAFESAKTIVEKFNLNRNNERVALLFVSSSYEWREKNPANTLSVSLDLNESTKTFFISGGSEAVISGIELASYLVDTEKTDYAILAVGERRRGENWEIDMGLSDGSGAMLITKENDSTLFKVEDFFHITEETYDISSKDGKISCPDERHVAQEQYLYLLKKILTKVKADRIFFSAPTYGIATNILKSLKTKDDVISSFGSLGNAQIPVNLTYATNSIKEDERILLVGFGNGVRAALIKRLKAKTDENILRIFERRKKMRFGNYAKIKDIIGFPEDESSISMLWREREQNLRLYGLKCEDCGNSIFPMQNYCIVCGSKNLKKEKMPREGQIFTLTEDYLTTYSDIFAPVPMLVVQLTNGARIYVQGTELEDGDRFKIGDKVELTLRILNSYKGFLNYFYKARKKID